MTTREKYRIKSFLLQQRLIELGEPIPGSGEEGAADAPTDQDLRDFIQIVPPEVSRKILKQNPAAEQTINAAFAREAEKNLTAVQRKQREAANLPGTARNPIKIDPLGGVSQLTTQAVQDAFHRKGQK
jgi:hypothetical protein